METNDVFLLLYQSTKINPSQSSQNISSDWEDVRLNKTHTHKIKIHVHEPTFSPANVL